MVFADTNTFASALAHRVVPFMTDVDTRQLRREGCAFWMLVSALACRLELFELYLDGGQVAINRLVKQAHLLVVELLAATAKLLAPEQGDLVSQLVDAGLPVMQLPFQRIDFSAFLRHLLVLRTELSEQLRGKGTQLLWTEVVEAAGGFMETSLLEPHTREGKLYTSPPTRQMVRITPSWPMRCHGSPSTKPANCSCVSACCLGSLPAWGQTNCP